MDEQTGKRTRRTPQQLAAEIDLKIEKLNQSIEEIEEKRASAMRGFDAKVETVKAKIQGLEQRKESLLAPKPPRKPRKTKKQKIQDIVKLAQKSGLKPEEIAEKLGVELPE